MKWDNSQNSIQKMGTIERKSRKKCKRWSSCSKCKNKRCNRNNQCGRRGICPRDKRECQKGQYNNFFDMIEETRFDMEMDIEESNTDLGYGNTGY